MIVQNDLFSDFEGLFSRLTPSRVDTNYTTPAVDAYRRGADVWVHIDLPGVSAESLDIDIERSILTVTAKRDVLRQNDDRTYLSERRRGTFRRQVRLGDSLDVEAIEANFSDGVLTLRLPVAEKAKARKVDVHVGPSKADISDTVEETSVETASAETIE